MSSSCLSAFELLLYFTERFVGWKKSVTEIAENLLEKLQTTSVDDHKAPDDVGADGRLFSSLIFSPAEKS